nr:hypothetical protein Iba_chr11aCG9060 [Ipomoea batatas]
MAASQRHAVTDSSSSQVPAGVEVRSANWKTDLDLSANCGDLASASATSPATARRRRSTLTSASLKHYKIVGLENLPANHFKETAITRYAFSPTLSPRSIHFQSTG